MDIKNRHNKHLNDNTNTDFNQMLKKLIHERLVQNNKHVQENDGNYSEELNQILDYINQVENKIKIDDKSKNNLEHNQRKKSKNVLKEKEFLPRNSLITNMFEIEHIKSLYHFFACLIGVIVFQNIFELIFSTNGSSTFFHLLKISFAKMHYVTFIWLIMFATTLSVFVIHRFWAIIRNQYLSKELIPFWDKLWLLGYICYQLSFLIGFAYYILTVSFTFGSSMLIYCEQTRFIMKSHAFIRSNISRVQISLNQSQTNLPTFSSYLYFLFAPTLVYRDHYPRTKQIRWNFVLNIGIEFIFTLFFIIHLSDKYILNYFGNYDPSIWTWTTLISKICDMVLPCICLYICAHYLLLHLWFNLWSELLTFADRQFYLDWWNVSTYSEFYRKWNIVVHDWLYTYIYKDCYENLTPNNLQFSFLSVFTISALVHEYILSLSMGFFYPVMFVFFAGVGTVMIFITRKFKQHAWVGNVTFWASCSIGNGLMISLYTMEFAKQYNGIKSFKI